LLEHDRFEELASLAAIGELSQEEYGEFLRHKSTCAQCREIVAETSSLATIAFLAGSPANDENSERQQRLRDGVAKRLPAIVPISFVERYKHLVAGGIAAGFLLGAGVGSAVGYRIRPAGIGKSPSPLANSAEPILAKTPVVTKDESGQLRAFVTDLRARLEQSRLDNESLQDKLGLSDRRAIELEATLRDVEKQSVSQSQEILHVQNELTAARSELSQANESISASHSRIDSLQYALADKETRLAEASASVEREREMLSEGREVRDIMGARDLHIVDVIDRDGKGRPRKAFGRAFYTQGKSLVFYAFDLPAKNTADGKFVYAAWGSNSNNLNSKAAHSLGIFYNDDKTQHRWAMKFADRKLLEEIDTVFVTLEPADKPFATPTGKPLLEAYFGTPPNHP
jgi:hypothetical protein